jgi:hypothetical protein
MVGVYHAGATVFCYAEYALEGEHAQLQGGVLRIKQGVAGIGVGCYRMYGGSGIECRYMQKPASPERNSRGFCR